jgi:Ca2+-binding EF-hand superfamily protein
VEFREFRVFLIALRQRFEYWVAFKRVDQGGDGRIDLQEFIAAQDMIQKWVGPIEDPAKEFAKIDANGGGQILFDEFCDWSISKDLDLEDDDDFEGD